MDASAQAAAFFPTFEDRFGTGFYFLGAFRAGNDGAIVGEDDSYNFGTTIYNVKLSAPYNDKDSFLCIEKSD